MVYVLRFIWASCFLGAFGMMFWDGMVWAEQGKPMLHDLAWLQNALHQDWRWPDAAWAELLPRVPVFAVLFLLGGLFAWFDRNADNRMRLKMVRDQMRAADWKPRKG